MKLNFNKALTYLDGEAYKDEKNEPLLMNKVLANNLIKLTTGDPLKLYDWAVALYKTGILDLDRADQEQLKSIIKGFTDMYIIAKAQMFEVFEKLEKDQ